MVRCGRRQGDGVGVAEDCWGSLLAPALCSAAAATADAQVSGRAVHGALERHHDAVEEAFDGVDLIGVQVLVGVVDGAAHHHEEQELEQRRQEASPGRGFGRGAARPGEALGVSAALGVDAVLNARLVQPVLARFYGSAGGPSDRAPAGRTDQRQ